MINSYYNKTPRTKVKRRSGRGRYDRETIEAILDEGVFGHLGIVSGGQPLVLPMLYARDASHVYLHGSPLSRLLGRLADGVPACLTVTLLDGLVLARSAFHHSMNYRSVVVIGEASPIRESRQKLAALDKIVEHVVPGRTADARGPSEKELEATEVVSLAIREVSAKIRTGPPIDAGRDDALPVWAGELPFRLSAGEPVPDSRCDAPLPDYVRAYARPDGAG
jgi:uncharacterized protein